eukprot:Blabericola_migrator_1__1178@NODE_12_length_24658_cov_176_683258_g9_i0_p14_GENE_NODE_12_length_24658_cov_176_683258_g9_i0NODE_12_length_24658_cov_176_683258_g9_i0_p14_ORF_typecomplete_len215_score40_19AhpCTSA/PF00578_21/3_1e23Redoxin/PF08534_10/1_3e141cysPrx_C/PF10417_9/2e09_NODE_12_length_24658_cov_176_683258_g9_i02117221816
MAQCMIGKQAPEIRAKAITYDGQIQSVSLSQFRGQYVVLFFYPSDFEWSDQLIAFDRAADEFRKRNVCVIGCSTDSTDTHTAWRQVCGTQVLLLSDLSHDICKTYGCYNGRCAVRAVYLLDKAHIVRHITHNERSIGWNVDEVLRMIDASQHTEVSGEVCPANWRKGDKAIVPTPTGVIKYLVFQTTRPKRPKAEQSPRKSSEQSRSKQRRVSH